MNTEELKALVDEMPDRDKKGMYCDTMSVERSQKIGEAIEKIHQAGKEALLGLIGLLTPPDDPDDFKAHYALHVLALHVCKLKDDKARSAYAQTLASQIGGKCPKDVQKYLIREIQVAGGKDVAAVLGKALLDEALCEPAAQALVAIGDGAAEQFRAALPKVKGKSRLTVVQNLGVLTEAAAVAGLKEAAAAGDADTRTTATWALAKIGDAGSADVVLQAGDKAKGFERIAHTKAAMLLAEKLLAAGKKDGASKIYSHLRDTRKDASEAYIRERAEKALADMK